MKETDFNWRNNKYIINYEANNKVATLYKIVNTNGIEEKVPVSKEELREILELLSNQYKSTNQEFNYDMNKINTDSIIELIINRLKDKKMTLGDVSDYLQKFELLEEDRKVIINKVTEFYNNNLKPNEASRISDFVKIYNEKLKEKRDPNVLLIVRLEKVGEEIKTKIEYQYLNDPQKTNHPIQAPESLNNTREARSAIRDMVISFVQNAPIDKNNGGQLLLPTGDGFTSDLFISNKNNARIDIKGFNNAFTEDLNEIAKKEQENTNTIKEDTPNKENDDELKENSFLDNMLPEERDAMSKQQEGPVLKRALYNDSSHNNYGKLSKTYYIIITIIALLLIAFVTYKIFNL